MEIKVEVKIPSVPNFFRIGDGLESIPVQDFTDDQLRQIGAEWTEKLIEAAHNKRHTPEPE